MTFAYREVRNSATVCTALGEAAAVITAQLAVLDAIGVAGSEARKSSTEATAAERLIRDACYKLSRAVEGHSG